MTQLIIVESPTKAKKIREYLGKGYKVLASQGHVRDIPGSKEIPAKYKGLPWARLGIDIDNDFTPIYVVSEDRKKQIKELKSALEEAELVYLATDEDREGEAIAWHLLEVLKPEVPVKRMVFHEITKSAIQKAVDTARQLDDNLVQAQEARRVLDRLYGYEVSPLLWRKIAQGTSAGRVQSVATKLLVEREKERMRFVSAEWWDVKVKLEKGGTAFEAELASVAGRKLARGSDFDDSGRLKKQDAQVWDAATAAQLGEALRRGSFRVEGVEREAKTSHARAPFTTSTYQQDAGRKLGLRAQDAMRVAQRLYENGFITYMRTDSMSLSGEARAAAARLVEQLYGREYLPPSPNFYGSKKGAQEAHEAIRPAGASFRHPDEVAAELGAGSIEARVYEMIWKRTLASQMAEERYTAIVATLSCDAPQGKVLAVARGRLTDFAGYRRVYIEGSDDPEAALDDREKPLPPLAVGDTAKVLDAVPESHATTPPSRYTEASLVAKMEELGIGRPSTYGATLETITSRGYSMLRGKTLVPQPLGFAVVQALEMLEPQLVDYGFTRDMEQELDKIAEGRLSRTAFLAGFWSGSNPGLEKIVTERAAAIEPRAVCTIPIGQHDGQPVELRVGKFGPYVQHGDSRGSVPEGLAPDEITVDVALQLIETGKKKDQPIGLHEGLPVYVRSGKYGPYIQWGDEPKDDEAPKPKVKRKKGEPAAKKAPKVKRVSVFKDMDPNAVTLETAVQLLALPRSLGVDPKDNRPIRAANGKFGPYLMKEPVDDGKPEYRRLKKESELLSVTLDEAIALFAVQPQKRTFGRAAATPKEPIAVLGPDPATQKEIRILEGKYGPYATDGETNATLPKGEDPKSTTLERAAALLAEKRAKGPTKKPARRRAARG
jgi:DNA topoisomerase-1